MTSTAVVSVHDVMPETFGRVLRIMGYLESVPVRPVTLLVVPGKDWSAGQIEGLKQFQQRGHEVAGHGWSHKAPRFSSLWHRIHGLLISRNEAEHLSRSERDIAGLILRCHRRLESAGLGRPELYVPPAWAMGCISRYALRKLPFRYYETLWGVYDSRKDTIRPFPVTGYMGDTPLRVRSLRVANELSRALARGPLRIAIHPDDLDLPLAGQLAAHLKRCESFVGYREVLDASPRVVVG